MKVKIHNEEYEMKIAPREMTAIFFSKGKIDTNIDYAYTMYHCPYPTDKNKLEEIKNKAILKANEDDYFENYLEFNKGLNECEK